MDLDAPLSTPEPMQGCRTILAGSRRSPRMGTALQVLPQQLLLQNQQQLQHLALQLKKQQLPPQHQMIILMVETTTTTILTTITIFIKALYFFIG